jgi:hypothetical protein
VIRGGRDEAAFTAEDVVRIEGRAALFAQEGGCRGDRRRLGGAPCRLGGALNRRRRFDRISSRRRSGPGRSLGGGRRPARRAAPECSRPSAPPIGSLCGSSEAERERWQSRPRDRTPRRTWRRRAVQRRNTCISPGHPLPLEQLLDTITTEGSKGDRRLEPLPAGESGIERGAQLLHGAPDLVGDFGIRLARREDRPVGD